MAKASYNHNFFGFLVIFGSSSTSNSPLQPFFHLQVFQNEKSYTFKKKKKKFFLLIVVLQSARNGKVLIFQCIVAHFMYFIF